MPSSHRRVGLVVDQPVEEALALLKSRRALPDATLARAAVLQGAALEGLQRSAARGGAMGREAAALLRQLSDALGELELPEAVASSLRQQISESLTEAGDEARRERQLEMLRAPNPYGEAVLDLSDEFDELEMHRTR